MLKRIVTSLFLEFPVRNKTMPELASNVVEAGEKLNSTIASKNDSDENRRMLSHIIGIERWAQRRLKVALGEPFVAEEYSEYRPKKETSWDDLKSQMIETRQDSAELAQQLVDANVSAEKMIEHNQFGDTKVRGWLRYVMFHAAFEAKRLK